MKKFFTIEFEEIVEENQEFVGTGLNDKIETNMNILELVGLVFTLETRLFGSIREYMIKEVKKDGTNNNSST